MTSMRPSSVAHGRSVDEPNGGNGPGRWDHPPLRTAPDHRPGRRGSVLRRTGRVGGVRTGPPYHCSAPGRSPILAQQDASLDPSPQVPSRFRAGPTGRWRARAGHRARRVVAIAAGPVVPSRPPWPGRVRPGSLDPSASRRAAARRPRRSPSPSPTGIARDRPPTGSASTSPADHARHEPSSGTDWKAGVQLPLVRASCRPGRTRSRSRR